MKSTQYLNQGEVPPPGVAAPEDFTGETYGLEKTEIQPKANIKVLEADTFHQFIFTADKPVLVDFWALWCSPCVHMIPIYEEIAEEYADELIIAKVNVDNCKALAGEYSIMRIPTMILFKDGEPVCSCEGTADKQQILEGIAPFMK